MTGWLKMATALRLIQKTTQLRPILTRNICTKCQHLYELDTLISRQNVSAMSTFSFYNRFFSTKSSSRKAETEVSDKLQEKKVVQQEDSNEKELMSREEQEKWARETLALSLKERFKVFKDEDSDVILDADEIHRQEMFEDTEKQEFSIYDQQEDEFAGYNLERGETGVFDVEELVDVLRAEKAKDICVISVPPELRYTNYLIVTSAFSVRHSKAMTEFLRKYHKRKKSEKDPYVQIEGANCDDWKVMDFGNIVLHVFLPETRRRYDLESLWTLGIEYDELSKQKTSLDEVLALMQPHIKYLDGMKPLVNNEK